MLPREQQEHIRKAFAILVKGLEVAIRLIESDLFDLSSTRNKDQRCVLNVLQHHGSQHMASMSPLLVCLLRQAMWCCEPMRSTGGPTHEGNCLYVTMIKRLSSNKQTLQPYSDKSIFMQLLQSHLSTEDILDNSIFSYFFQKFHMFKYGF